MAIPAIRKPQADLCETLRRVQKGVRWHPLGNAHVAAGRCRQYRNDTSMGQRENNRFCQGSDAGSQG